MVTTPSRACRSSVGPLEGASTYNHRGRKGGDEDAHRRATFTGRQHLERFWSGGVSNPLSVIEQITYLLFIERLDELHTVEERKAATLNIPMERQIFPKGKDE